MRFRPHDNIIELLIGERFYTSPEPAVRELLQNAEDACNLQSISDDAYVAAIRVRYSPSGAWFEIFDNGLGMNRESIEQSFALVGAPKDSVEHIRQLMERSPDRGAQIGQFGIGVLSCFGVASSVEVHTKMDEQDGVQFLITDYREDFPLADDNSAERGTTIRLQLKPDGGMQADSVPSAAHRYARHAPHITIENADTGDVEEIREQWSGSGQRIVRTVEDTALRGGFLGLDDAWTRMDVSFQSQLTICNGGFLVQANEPNLLPQHLVGVIGELDVNPGQLSILLNREGYQQDDRWQQLGVRLTTVYNDLIEKQLDEWENRAQEDDIEPSERAIERGLLVLTHGPTRSLLREDLLERLDAMLPGVVRVHLADAPDVVPIAEVVRLAAERSGVAYFTREGEGARQIQQSISEGSGSIQVTETAQTEGLRASMLKAKGAVVVSCRPHTYSVQFGASAQQVTVHDQDLVAAELGKSGSRWLAVIDAPAEDVALAALPESVLISGLLGMDGLNLIVLENSSERVIRDYASRLLNCAHPEVREVLEILPEFIGNPVWRSLLQVYVDLSNYSFDRARARVKSLLVMSDLHEQAQIPTGRLLAAYLRAELSQALAPIGG